MATLARSDIEQRCYLMRSTQLQSGLKTICDGLFKEQQKGVSHQFLRVLPLSLTQKSVARSFLSSQDVVEALNAASSWPVPRTNCSR